jgi:hypothetical protein
MRARRQVLLVDPHAEGERASSIAFDAEHVGDAYKATLPDGPRSVDQMIGKLNPRLYVLSR